MSECSQVQIRIVEAGVQYESHVEQTVINKLQQVLDVDVPNIKKQKALLTKLVLEMDLARARYFYILYFILCHTLNKQTC